jgi:hypothetical protein
MTRKPTRVQCASAFCIFVVGICTALAGCSPAPSPVPRTAEATQPVPRTQDLAGAQVYDEHGQAAPCGPVGTGCPPQPASNDFLDRCRLAGFRVLMCGCDQRCTGNVAAVSRHYDPSGQPKECAPARPDCTPPQASAAFQDACTEHGYRLDVCGCEWLCSGDFKH